MFKTYRNNITIVVTVCQTRKFKQKIHQYYGLWRLDSQWGTRQMFMQNKNWPCVGTSLESIKNITHRLHIAINKFIKVYMRTKL